MSRQKTVDAHALFVGPQLYVRLSEDFSAKVAWAAQIPDVASHSLDLKNYQRHQVELQFAYTF